MNARLIPSLSQQQDPLRRQTHERRRLARNLQKRLLRNKSLCARILELLSQLLGRIRGIGRARHAAGPVDGEVDYRHFNVVWREEAHDMALFPVQDMAETLAEFEGQALDVIVRVGFASVTVDKDG